MIGIVGLVERHKVAKDVRVMVDMANGSGIEDRPVAVFGPVGTLENEEINSGKEASYAD